MSPQDQSPRFFGDESSLLFGVFHQGRGSIVRDTAILLCYPAPQEYSMAHWSYRELAVRLADAGFPVLRFDYFGTGDSAGDSADATLARWVDDIDRAAEELREASGVRRLSIIGMRLGAALAVRAVARGLRVRDVVLWDPVVNGADYVRVMDLVDRRVHRARHYPISDRRPEGELFGYPFGHVLRQETTSIDLLVEPLGAPRRLLIVSLGANSSHGALLQRITGEGISADSAVVEDPPLYDETTDPLDTLLAHASLRAIGSFLGARGA